jgi:hypothetical protein
VSGLDALQPLDYVSARERRLPAARRTAWTGLLRTFPVDDSETGHHDLRAAYIWSSEEAPPCAGPGSER